MQSLNSAAPAQPAREGSSGTQWEQWATANEEGSTGEHQGWGKERDPGIPHSQPSGAWMLFLDARARNSSPAPVPSARPSIRRPLFHGNQQQSSRFSSTNLQASPAQPALFCKPHVPITTSDLDVGCLVKAGQGKVGIRCGRRINTHSLVVSRPSLLLHTLLISTVFVALVSTQTDCIDWISLVQFSSVPISLASRI